MIAVWLIALVQGIVIGVWATAGLVDCRNHMPLVLLLAPTPDTEVVCYWGEEPELGKPLPLEGLQL